MVRIKKHDPCSLRSAVCTFVCAFKPEKVQSLEWKGLGTEKEDIGNYFATFHLLVLHFYHICTNTDENGCTNENMHVSQVSQVLLLKNATDRHSELFSCSFPFSVSKSKYLLSQRGAVPPGSTGWQLKRQNLSRLLFGFWCCWFIVSASLCACWGPARNSLKLPFPERRQFKWNLSALALTFQKKKEARISFEVSNSKWVRWGRTNSSYLLILFPWQPPPTSPRLWNEWQQATVSPFQLLGEVWIPWIFSTLGGEFFFNFQGKSWFSHHFFFLLGDEVLIGKTFLAIVF